MSRSCCIEVSCQSILSSHIWSHLILYDYIWWFHNSFKFILFHQMLSGLSGIIWCNLIWSNHLIQYLIPYNLIYSHITWSSLIWLNLILSHFISFYLIQSNFIQLNLIWFYLISSNMISFYHILCDAITFYLIWSIWMALDYIPCHLMSFGLL